MRAEPRNKASFDEKLCLLRISANQEKICELGKFDESTDLQYASDRYIDESSQGGINLLLLLKELFIVNEAEKVPCEIASAGWRRIYTTNYDNLIEKSLAQSAMLYESVILEDIPSDSGKQGKLTQIVHINGAIERAAERNFQDDFKLTLGSYLAISKFKNSYWGKLFERDVICASAIIFVGYSLYDAEIRDLLYNFPELKEKTYFIVHDTAPVEDIYKLKKFGTVLPIFASGFANLLTKFDLKKNTFRSDINCFRELVLTKVDIDYLSDPEFDNFLLMGDVSSEAVEACLNSPLPKRFFVARKQVKNALDALIANAEAICCLSGDLGCGKSFAALELELRLLNLDFGVYDLIDAGGDIAKDMQEISLRHQSSLIVVDNYDSRISAVREILANKIKGMRVLLLARTFEHDKCKAELKPRPYLDFDLDILSDLEIDELVSIFSHFGKTSSFNTVDRNAIQKSIIYNHGRQIGNVLTKVFSSPLLRSKISEVFKKFSQSPESKKILMAIAFIDSLGIQKELQLVRDVSNSDLVYDSNFRANFAQLVRIQNGSFFFASSVLSTYILKGFVRVEEITSFLLDVAIRYSIKSQRFGESADRVWKGVVRFADIQPLFSDQGKTLYFYRYYDSLRKHVPYLASDPHYWLQYSIAYLAYDDLIRSQEKLDHAFKIALSKKDYDTLHMDNHQARIWLLNAIREQNIPKAFSLFSNAVSTLRKAPADKAKMRVVDKVVEFANVHVLSFSEVQRRILKDTLNSFREELKESQIEVYGSTFDPSYWRSFDRIDACIDKMRSS